MGRSQSLCMVALCLGAAWMLCACSADSGSSGEPRRGGGDGMDAGAPPASGGEVSQEACTDGIDNDGDGAGDCDDSGCARWVECGGTADGDGSGGGDGDGSGGEGTGGDGLDECAAVRAEAEATFAPVDILFVVDSSGSMNEEAGLVQEQINDFAASISSSGVDYHVVMMTDPAFVTVPPPLGTDDTRYRFINQPIGSHQAFEQLLNHWDDYADFLRPDAETHIVVVTDDESDMGDEDFKRQMEAKLGHPFRFHGVASPDEENCRTIVIVRTCHACEGPYGEAENYGEEYHQLVMSTGGTWFSICSADWSALWATLAESVLVSALLPCTFDLPEPPEGEMFDKEKVNLVLTRPDGTEDALPRAADMSACTADDGSLERAWYYDDPEAPTEIRLCEGACTFVESAPEGSRIDIALGCETEVVIF